MSAVLQLTKNLISRRSVTPDDAGCQAVIAERLQAKGFDVEWIYADEVTNVLMTHGHGGPHVMLLGHTDVVPSGPEEDWSSPPFSPVERDGLLYGRGAADMKGAVAAMVVALERYVEEFPNHPGTLSLVLTSDEEGPSTHGVRVVAKLLEGRALVPDYCLVGEPSSLQDLGDNVRIGRRGSINAELTVHGVQGHTAYSDRVVNPVHLLSPFLAELTALQWDDGDAHFPATSLQVSNFAAGAGASNVTPGHATVNFNIRNAPESSGSKIKQQLLELMQKHAIKHFDLDWKVSGEPFFTRPGRLSEAVTDAVDVVLHRKPELDTGGGTSDGRFIAPLGTEVVEIGPVNRTIHQVDECVSVADLDHLFVIYFESLRRLIDT